MPTTPLTAALAKLILLRNSKELPEPKAINTYPDSVDVEVCSLDDFRAWRKALGVQAANTRIWDLGNGVYQHEAATANWQATGWRINVQVNVNNGMRGPSLDDDTAVALMAVTS